VPAALVGVDVGKLLERALAMADACGPSVATGDNPAAWLGAVIGELARSGRDKLTLVTPRSLPGFGDWVEQLIAESTGKEGTGILPVVGEPLGPPAVYGGDRLFVQLRPPGDDSQDTPIRALEGAGFPVVRLELKDKYDLGGQFFLWELATAVVGHRLGINPFDQPNVEAAKMVAREMIAAYVREGALPPENPVLSSGGIDVYGDVSAASPAEALAAFLEQGVMGDYVALQAYVQPTAETDAALRALRSRLRDQYRLATTVGYGPRFLHSTGQLHKGDGGNGLFVQFTSDAVLDALIPRRGGSTHIAHHLRCAQAGPRPWATGGRWWTPADG